jgi:hypothetical protein
MIEGGEAKKERFPCGTAEHCEGQKLPAKEKKKREKSNHSSEFPFGKGRRRACFDFQTCTLNRTLERHCIKHAVFYTMPCFIQFNAFLKSLYKTRHCFIYNAVFYTNT